MTNDIKLDYIRAALEELTDVEIVYVWNLYTENMRYDEDRVYSMDEFDDLFSDYTPMQIVEAVTGNEFDPRDPYMYYDRRGNLASFGPDWRRGLWGEGPIDLDDVAEDVLENPEVYGEIAEISAALDRIEREEWREEEDADALEAEAM